MDKKRDNTKIKLYHALTLYPIYTREAFQRNAQSAVLFYELTYLTQSYSQLENNLK